jgi:hypothetical protein
MKDKEPKTEVLQHPFLSLGLSVSLYVRHKMHFKKTCVFREWLQTVLSKKLVILRLRKYVEELYGD